MLGVAGRSLTHKDSWVTEQEAPARPIRHLWEAPVFTERTSVGLDVHARSIVAAAVDGQTSELHQARLTPSFEHVRSWLATLPGPVAVAYEAGPTGFESVPRPDGGGYPVRGGGAEQATASGR